MQKYLFLLATCTGLASAQPTLLADLPPDQEIVKCEKSAAQSWRLKRRTTGLDPTPAILLTPLSSPPSRHSSDGGSQSSDTEMLEVSSAASASSASTMSDAGSSRYNSQLWEGVYKEYDSIMADLERQLTEERRRQAELIQLHANKKAPQSTPPTLIDTSLSRTTELAANISHSSHATTAQVNQAAIVQALNNAVDNPQSASTDEERPELWEVRFDQITASISELQHKLKSEVDNRDGVLKQLAANLAEDRATRESKRRRISLDQQRRPSISSLSPIEEEQPIDLLREELGVKKDSPRRSHFDYIDLFQQATGTRDTFLDYDAGESAMEFR